MSPVDGPRFAGGATLWPPVRRRLQDLAALFAALFKQRRVKIGVSVFAAVVLIVAVAFGPLVRSRAAAHAARRGIEIDVDSVRPGWGRVWLRGVDARIADVPAVKVHLDALEVELHGLGVTALRVHGATVTLRGEPAELEREIDAWRARRARNETGRARPMVYAANGVQVDWQGAAPGAPPQQVWGLSYIKDIDNKQQFRADLARLSIARGSVELERPSAVLGRDGEKLRVERLAAEAVTATVDLDGSSTVDGLLDHGALESAVQRSEQKRPATVPARHLTRDADGRSAILALFAAPDAAAAERGPKLRTAFARAAMVIGDALPVQSELDLNGVRLKLKRGTETLNIGPGRLQVGREPNRVALEYVPASAARDSLALRAEVPFTAGPVRMVLNGGPMSLATLGILEGDFGLLDVKKARIEARGNVELAPDGRALTYDLAGKLVDLSIRNEALSTAPVHGIKLAFRGKGEAELDGSKLKIDEAELEVGAVHATLRGNVERGARFTHADLRGGVPLASCQLMLDSLPEGLAPLLSGMRLDGTFALDAHLDIETSRLENMRFYWKLANDCRITATPADIAPRRFRNLWVREVRGADGRLLQVETGPGSEEWVPFASISPNVETAVLICEDGHFRRHRGFDDEAIKNSFRENVRAGRFLRGASTISMQLAKNLYLSREKTVSRKLQEAVLTSLLEQELSKDEILELYLNVIEFGPGLYGIGPAARHYFNTTPSRLSLGQALYLASILPNPKIQHFGADGAVTAGWSNYLRKLMYIAVKIHRISDEELEEALREQVTFGVPYSPRTSGDVEVGETDVNDAAAAGLPNEGGFSGP